MVDYRPATAADVADIDRIVRAAYNALSRKHGFPEIPAGTVNPIYAFAIANEGEGCWVAEAEGRVAGVSIASVREPVWFLAYLFIDPSSQARGIGRQLIERALAYGGERTTVRSLITFAYNPASISLYLRYGMFPIEPIYAFDAEAAELRRRLTGQTSLDSEIAAPSEATAALLATIDSMILGMQRIKVHRFLLQVPGNACRIFRADGTPSGYAYASAAGRVGPVAAVAPLSFESVLDTALTHAAGASQARVSIMLAGSNAPASAMLIEHGLRITTPLVLMASRRLGDLGRYAFHSAGIM